MDKNTIPTEKYEVAMSKKGTKQVRFWSHPKMIPINLEDIHTIISKEFKGVKPEELWFVPGVANFWIEQKTSATLDTEN
jgi:hypothetical protein